MLHSRCLRFSLALLGLSLLAFPAEINAGAACVWKVAGPKGGIAYLGGSVHSLQKSDYPLPAAYMRAFDASSRMAFEVDSRGLKESSDALVRFGKYPPGDNLKKHVDPRTYAYMRELFSLMNVPEETLLKYRPWFIVMMIQAAAMQKELPELGVDEVFMKRAAKRNLPIVGLETVGEHARVFSGLTDRESEILLLLTFVPGGHGGGKDDMMKAWRRGDADTLAAMMEQDSADLPAFNYRLLGARNRSWVPKIENFVASGHTYFVIVGAAHFGGKNGLLALLRAKGYQVEQL